MSAYKYKNVPISMTTAIVSKNQSKQLLYDEAAEQAYAFLQAAYQMQQMKSFPI